MEYLYIFGFVAIVILVMLSSFIKKRNERTSRIEAAKRRSASDQYKTTDPVPLIHTEPLPITVSEIHTQHLSDEQKHILDKIFVSDSKYTEAHWGDTEPSPLKDERT